MSAPVAPRALLVMTGLAAAVSLFAGCPGRSGGGNYEQPGKNASAPPPSSAELRAAGSTSPWETDTAGDEYIGDNKPAKQSFWQRKAKPVAPDNKPYAAADAPYERPSAGGGYPAPSNDPYGGGYPPAATAAQPPYGDPYAANSAYGGATPVTSGPMGYADNVRGVDTSGLGVHMGGGSGVGVSPITSAPGGPAGGGQPFYPTDPATASAPRISGATASGPTPPLPPTFGGAAPAASRPELEMAKQLVRDKRYLEARATLEQELGRRPDDAEAWLWYGDCLYNMLQLQPAVDAYDKCLALDASNYFARRGQGFAYLHLGHDYWARQDAARQSGDTAAADQAFKDAHEQYKRALQNLRECVKRDPSDDEAVYGRGMAAEGFSRRLYSLARAWLKAAEKATNARDTERNRGNANQFAAQCTEVIRDGLEAAQQRVNADPRDSGPRALAGSLFLRLAMLNHFLGKEALATQNLQRAVDVQESILRDIDPNNPLARAAVEECRRYLAGQWPDSGTL